jgi:hypothetical protein
LSQTQTFFLEATFQIFRMDAVTFGSKCLLRASNNGWEGEELVREPGGCKNVSVFQLYTNQHNIFSIFTSHFVGKAVVVAFRRNEL